MPAMPEPDSNLVALPIAEAAAAMRLSTEAVRTRIRRGHLEARTSNLGRKLVLVPRSQLKDTESEAGPDGVRAVTELRTELDRVVAERDQARSDVEGWRVKAEQARLDAVRAVAERDALRGELTRLREPWWQRWFNQGAGR